MRKRRPTAVLGASLLAILCTALPASAMSAGQPVTDPNSAPWVANLAIKGDGPLLQLAGCGGALIAPDRVLTAAHCALDTDPSQTQVHVNARVLSQDPGEVRDIRGVSVLPGFQILPSPADPANTDDASARNDLAVILLARPVTDIAPLPIAPGRPAAGAPVSLFAHGTTGQTGSDFRDDVLHRGDLTTITQAACQASTPAQVDEASVWCGQDLSGSGIAGCFQDSGSPLVDYVNGRPELAGVFSFGQETAGKPCTPDGGQAFADPTAFREWIYQPFPPLEPFPARPATVTGRPAVGKQLGCTTPVWSRWRGGRPNHESYQWVTITTVGPFHLPNPIEGATGRTFTVTSELAGKQLACGVIAVNPAGEILTTAAPVAIPSS